MKGSPGGPDVALRRAPAKPQRCNHHVMPGNEIHAYTVAARRRRPLAIHFEGSPRPRTTVYA